MSKLALTIGIGTSPIALDTALDVGSYPAPFLIDDEAILVTGGDGSKNISVLRGQNGTAIATHTAGTDLVEGWYTGGGGSQTLDETLALSTGEDIADALSGAAAPDAANVFATIADIGGGGAVTILSADIAFDTAGLNNPDDNGAQVITIPAHSYVEVELIYKTAWNQPGVLAVTVGTSDNGVTVGNYDPRIGSNIAGLRSSSPQQTDVGTTVPDLAANAKMPAYTPAEAFVVVAFYPDLSDPSAGAATIVAKVYPLTLA